MSCVGLWTKKPRNLRHCARSGKAFCANCSASPHSIREASGIPTGWFDKSGPVHWYAWSMCMYIVQRHIYVYGYEYIVLLFASSFSTVKSRWGCFPKLQKHSKSLAPAKPTCSRNARHISPWQSCWDRWRCGGGILHSLLVDINWTFMDCAS